MKKPKRQTIRNACSRVEYSKINRKQTRNKSGHLSYEDIRRGHGHVRNKLERFRAEGISYVTADSVHESDLQGLALILESLPYSIIWPVRQA
ncbi:four-carbon acid sugar kinase family protein [Bacillus licheniformis]|nr:four-carbon acid sugar kinase family protein [Bacillus licheniformis]